MEAWDCLWITSQRPIVVLHRRHVLHGAGPLPAAPVSHLHQLGVVTVRRRWRLFFVRTGARADDVAVVAGARLAADVRMLECFTVAEC